MKKALSVFVILLSAISLYAGGFTVRKAFDFNTVNKINVSLTSENIIVSSTKNSEIVIVVETNKKDLIPEIEQADNTLQIKSNPSALESKVTCDVNIILPEQYTADSINLSTSYGKVSISKISAKYVKIHPGVENTISNIKTDSFEVTNSDQADITINNLDCKTCIITRTAGSVKLSFAKAPTEESFVSTKQGTITVMIPRKENFTISADSFSSKLINKYTNAENADIRGGFTYQHNKGGAVIHLKTHTGDIIIDRN